MVRGSMSGSLAFLPLHEIADLLLDFLGGLPDEEVRTDGRAKDGQQHLSGLMAMRQVRDGLAVGGGRARGDVAADEQGGDSGGGSADHRECEHRGRSGCEGAVTVEQAGGEQLQEARSYHSLRYSRAVPDTKPETARVDPAATRRRLASFIGSEGYKPDILARVARLSLELKEPAQAGRYWLLSDASGPEVDEAIERFADSCQRTPRLMVSELPRFSRDWDIEAYPEVVRARIDKYGLRDELARRERKKRVTSKSGMTALAIAGLIALLVLGALLVLLRR